MTIITVNKSVMAIKANLSTLAEVYHPGVTLDEKLAEMGMGIKEFALRVSKPEKTIIAVISGKSSITTEMAVSFENVTKIPASFWLRKQQAYDEYLVRKRREELAVKSAEWMKKFPVREMMKRGWLETAETVEGKVQSLLSFFAISSEKAWEDYYLNQELKVVFRISLSRAADPYAISAWLRQGEIMAKGMTVDREFDGTVLKNKLNEMKALMVSEAQDFFPKLQSLCSDCGVKLLLIGCLPKAPVNGATRWIGNAPVIQLSDRYKRYDIFWFTFFHEIAHILLHGKKEVFLEDVTDMETDLLKEKEADAFSSEILLPQSAEKEIIQSKDYSGRALKEAAKRFGTHPSVIVGRLQHKKVIGFAKNHELLKKVDFRG